VALAGVAAAFAVLAAAAAQNPSANQITFSEHVAPIVFTRCATCHRPGQVAPFSLLTYEDARRHGTTIAEVTESHFMPPWKPDGGDIEFQGDRRLTQPQIETIQRWVAGGMPEGDRGRLPRAPSFDAGWPLGEPDLVLSMPEPFVVPADGPDIYRNFVLPTKLSRDTWVKAVDFRPSAGGVVHHAAFLLDSTGEARQKDKADPLPGYGGVMGGGLTNGPASPAELVARARGVAQTSPAQAAGRAGGGGAIGGWAPGGGPKTLPDDLAYFVPAGADVVLSVHFHPTGKAEREASKIALYFARRPPTKPFLIVTLPPYSGAFKGINIPPGATQYTVTDSFVLPADARAFAVSGHAHYLGKELTLTATVPGHATMTLFSISDWDINWQGTYFFKDYVSLPAGTRLDATIRYDNSAANVRNPFNPPQRVTFGEQSTNEMGMLVLLIVAGQPGGAPTLRTALEQHLQDAVRASPMMGGRGRGPG
jgi:mono/diheme cytochrome c family protein